MRQVRLDGVDVAVSRFIFGTGSLFRCGTAAQRGAMLSAAVDAGFTHFDTAPYYGYGTAERDLAPLLRTNPNLGVTTKVGLYAPGGHYQSSLQILLRKVGGRLISSLSRPERDFALARAKGEFDASLRRLGRDMIDIYALHEPELAMLDGEEWTRWLEQLVEQGKVRAFGVALTAEKLAPLFAAGTGLTPLIQVGDSLSGKEADILAAHGRPTQITYGYASRALAGDIAVDMDDILAQALRRNASGAIIVSTTKAERLPLYARIAEAVDAGQ